MGCCVLCKKKVKRGAGAFFQAPQDDERYTLWKRICQREFKKRDLVCADHFSPTDYILGQKRATLLPKAVPIPPSPNSTFISPIEDDSVGDQEEGITRSSLSMSKRTCIMGCPPMGHPKYPFPWDKDRSRRKMWFQQFTLDPAVYTQKYLYACRRHFSSYMTLGRNLRHNAYPDVNLYPFSANRPYAEKYSYYENAYSKPDERYHDNVGKKADDFVQTHVTDIQYAPVSYQFSMNNYLHENEAKIVTHIGANEQIISTNQQSAIKIESKRECILKCPGMHTYYRIPSADTDLELRKKWFYLLGKDPALYTKNNVYVCNLHFDEHMICLKRLVRGGYPNKNLPPPLRKPVPEAWEQQTECIQKCTDYTRKYPFPSYGKEKVRRQSWLKQFNRVPELYKDAYIYACDRHFTDRERVGPYLYPEAIPELNLPPNNTANGSQASYISKKWSLQRLDALAKNKTGQPPTEYVHTTQQITRPQPHQQSPLHSSQKPNQQPIQLSLLGPSQNASRQPIQFSVIQTPQNISTQQPFKLSLLCPPQYASQPVQLSLLNQPPNTTQEPVKLTPIRPKEDEILKRLKMLKMQHMSTNSSKAEEYVKIQTLGVFVPHKDGHFVAMNKVLSSIDPLDTKQYAPLDWVEPIEPQLPIKAHPIPKELYETTDEELSDGDIEVAESPEYLEWSDEDTSEVTTVSGKRINENLINYGNTKCLKIANQQDRNEDDEMQYKVDDPVVVDTILDQLTAAFPKDNKKYTIVLAKNNTVIECKKQPETTSEPLNIITPTIAPQVVTKVLEPTVKTITPKTKKGSSVEIDFEDMIVGQQIQKSDEYMREKEKMLTTAVVSAESWQQVMSAIKEATPNTGFAESSECDSDEVAKKVRKMVEEIKQACERDKQGIGDAKISKKVSEPSKTGEKMVKFVAKSMPVCNQPAVITAETIKNNTNPNRVIIKSIEIIKPANIGTQVSKVMDKRATVKSVPNSKTHAELITTPQLKNVKIASVMVPPKKAQVISPSRPTAIKAPILQPTEYVNHHHNANEDEFENVSIEDLLAKAKRLINESDTKVPNNSELLLDNAALLEDDAVLNNDVAIDQCVIDAADATYNPPLPSCIFKCIDFLKLHAFPSAETSTYRRHFWFMELGLDISVDWLKPLHICDKHFDENMFLTDNTLKEFAYPCKELKPPQHKSFRVERAAQTRCVGDQYKQNLLDELTKLSDLNNRQNIELNRIKVLIRLKQEAARLVAEIKTAKELTTEQLNN
uniref:THAP-type domain-containing protein n=3 Tax=Ceratitis capitata TaxID=7213 RepID=W8AVY5_CERCA